MNYYRGVNDITYNKPTIPMVSYQSGINGGFGGGRGLLNNPYPALYNNNNNHNTNMNNNSPYNYSGIPPVRPLIASNLTNNYQPLEARIIQARQANIVYKQKIGQMLLQNQQQQQQPKFQPKLTKDDVSLSNAFRGGEYGAAGIMNNLPPSSEPSLSSNAPNPSAEISREQNPSLSSQSYSSIAPTTTSSSALYHKQLYDLIDNLHSKSTDHNKHLEECKNEQISLTKRKELQKKEEHKQVRERIEALLQKDHHLDENDDTTRQIIRLPLWKHKLNGNPKPPSNQILKGIALFRVIAYGVLGMIIRPKLIIQRRKLQAYEHNKHTFIKTLQITIETMEEWIGKVVQLPISSIVTDLTLDFEPKENFGTTALATRMLPLKIRLKAVITSLCEAKLPTHLLNNLVGLIAEESYYPDDFFWDCEKRSLEFDSLGGIRRMIAFKNIPQKGAVKVPFEFIPNHPILGNTPATPSPASLAALSQEVYAETSRAKVLLLNVILVRILIFKVILSPWLVGVCNKPVNRHTRKAIKNLRVLATILYRYAQQINPILSPLLRDAKNDTLIQKNKLASSTKDGHELDGNGNNNNSLLIKMFQLAGVKIDETPGFEEFKEGSIEHFLLEARPSQFDSLDDMKRFLLYEKDLDPIHRFLDDWEHDFYPILNEWSETIVNQIVLEKIKTEQASSKK